jgi:golgi SNAP receptor complex member 1
MIDTQLAISATTPHQQATVKRYREIVHDMTTDMEQCHTKLRQAQQRRELWMGSSLGNNNNDDNNNDPAMAHLLRERNHIHNSVRTADVVLGQADQIRSELRTQGRTLRTIGTTIGQMAQHVPGMNYLIEQIRRRRSRDDYVVAGVIASCILFTLWYILG